MRPWSLLLVLASTLGALYAGGLVYEIDLAPAGCCSLSWPTPDPFAAERNLAEADPGGRDAGLQRRTALEVLGARPMDAQAWLRLAYADRLNHAGLTADGVRDVEMSYLMLPYAYRQAPWRIGFALDNWSRLTSDARKDVLREVAVARQDQEVWPQVRAAARRGALDPSGRMTAALLGMS